MNTGSIHKLSWEDTSFPSKLQLFFQSRRQEGQKIRSSDRLIIQAEGYSVLSSTYYSIASTAFSHLKETTIPWWLAPLRIILWCLTWLPLAVWCFLRMLPLSNRVVELVGYDSMSVDMCDVRQSILRRWRKYDEAKVCILVALTKNQENAHTRGLLHVGLAEIYRRENNVVGANNNFWRALDGAIDAEDMEPLQAARIYRHCAEMVRRGQPGFSVYLYEKARTLAQNAGSQDQLLKLQQ